MTDNNTALRLRLKQRRERMELYRDAIIDVVSTFVPLSAPAVPAALTWAAIVEHYPTLLHIPAWAAVIIGLIAALAVESLGVLSVETALSMWQWNQTADNDDRAPLWLAVTATAVYLVTVILLVVLLKMFPAWALGSLLPLSTLGVIASVIAVSRKQHGERIFRRDIAVAEADAVSKLTADNDNLLRQLADKERQVERLLSQRAAVSVTMPPVDNDKLTPTQRRDKMLTLLADYDTPDDIDYAALAGAVGVSDRTARRDVNALVKSGKLSLNGHVSVTEVSL